MGALTTTQIAETLNDAYTEVFHADNPVPVADDLSNIMDAGENITSLLSGDLANQYFTNIIDKVGLTEISDPKGVIGNMWQKIRKTSMQAGLIYERIRFTQKETGITEFWKTDFAWDSTGGSGHYTSYEAQFGFHPVEAVAKYFKKKFTFASEIYTITMLQWKAAVRSAADMHAFIAGIQEKWRTRIEMAKEQLAIWLIGCFMADKFAAKNACYNLLAEYIAETGDTTMTADKAKFDPDFLRWACAYINIKDSEILRYSDRFNVDENIEGIGSALRFVYSPFMERMSSQLLSNTYNPEKLNVPDFDSVPYWQAFGSTDDVKQAIYLKTQNNDSARHYDGIVALIADERAFAIIDENPRTVANRNNFDEWTNYQSKLDCSAIYDTGYNGMVFYISDYEPAYYYATEPDSYADWLADVEGGLIYTKSVDTSTGEVTFTQVEYDEENEPEPELQTEYYKTLHPNS